MSDRHLRSRHLHAKCDAETGRAGAPRDAALGADRRRDHRQVREDRRRDGQDPGRDDAAPHRQVHRWRRVRGGRAPGEQAPDQSAGGVLAAGMTGINAYDGKTGWKIEPWQGKKDPEALSEEEMKQIVEDADFDEALVNYRQKGNKVEFAGTEQVEGTDVYKLKVTLASGDLRYYYMDTDYYVPIKIDIKRMIRGAEQEFETTLGDYKAVAGWYLPYSIETTRKGSEDTQKITFEKIEANVPVDDGRFAKPGRN